MNQTTPQVKTSPKNAVNSYATYLSSLSLCVDYAVHPPQMFFSNTKQCASIETITAKWPKWAKDNNVFIDDSEPYAEFKAKLQTRVKAKLAAVYGCAFKPVNARFFDAQEGVLKANTFVPFLPPQAPDAPQVLTEYFERLFPNEDDRRHVRQFLGHAFQFPLVRPAHALMITGVQGNGKSTLPILLRKALGDRHVFEDNSYSSAFKEFSADLPDNMFVVFDDAKGDRNTHNRLKLEITRRSQSVNVKYQTHPELREVYARVIVLSNSRTPLVMDNCRRFYATEFSTHTNMHNPEGDKANTDAFFSRFFAWLQEPESAAQLRQFFLSIELQGDKPFNAFSIPQTPTLLEMIDAGRSATGTLIEGYVADKPCFHMNQLFAYLKGNNVQHPSLDTVTKILKALGYNDKRRIVDGCGPKQIDVWVPPAPPGKKKTRLITAEEAAEIATAVTF